MISFLLQVLEDDASKQSFLWLYQTHHSAMEQTALALLRNQRDAEDAVQNAFVQVIRHFDRAKTIPSSQLGRWLAAVVRNEARMILRQRRKSIAMESWEAVEAQAEEAADYRALVELFRQLPETYRSTLEMRFLYGYSEKEIARKLGISQGAVSTRIHRGRKLLQDIAKKEGIFP